jgi:two-component system CheB/CheR fusion protein
MDITALARLADEHDERKRELEKAHEELQSTKEELETTNEELRSTNEELETLNRQQLERSNELDRANLFLEGILTNLGVGVVVLDVAHNVEVWNGDSAELCGLRAEEVEGRAFAELDIGLPVKEMGDALGAALSPAASSSSLELDAVNRRGSSLSAGSVCCCLRRPGVRLPGCCCSWRRLGISRSRRCSMLFEGGAAARCASSMRSMRSACA